ncbi:GNAT family N-acetyltransferase [Embleya scabrispora]|uniref:GNAT family N-acetyltransferase n=1 Tax=Embleya scabrispora TaxID=159449 RepID=UPI001FE183E4|nr:GNAT family N-acetyltransferase [Embleya scabrispora]
MAAAVDDLIAGLERGPLPFPLSGGTPRPGPRRRRGHTRRGPAAVVRPVPGRRTTPPPIHRRGHDRAAAAQQEDRQRARVRRRGRHHGIATEAAFEVLRFAFEYARVPRLISVCHEDNTASVKVMSKPGMRAKGGTQAAMSSTTGLSRSGLPAGCRGSA